MLLGGGRGVFLSRDGGLSFERVFDLQSGAGPVAWAPATDATAYAVGLDRVLYRTTDRGRSWMPAE